MADTDTEAKTVPPATFSEGDPADEQSLEPDADAPFGYTIDRATGQRRAKLLPGRPVGSKNKTPEPAAATSTLGNSPPLEDLKTAAVKDKQPEDRPPGKPKKTRTTRRGTEKTEPDIPPFRAGPIAKGMNKLYARAGKIVRVMDPAIGEAILSITRKETDDDVTVGEAWEDLAKTNPRIRAFLLKMIAGGAWGQLFMAHAPIFLAVIMKDGIKKHIPFLKLIEAMLSPDEDGGPSDISQALGGLTTEDAEQVMAMAQGLMGQMGAGLVFKAPNATRPPTVDGEVQE